MPACRVQVGAAHAAPGDADDRLAFAGLGIGHVFDGEGFADRLEQRCFHFSLPTRIFLYMIRERDPAIFPNGKGTERKLEEDCEALLMSVQRSEERRVGTGGVRRWRAGGGT